MAVARMAKGTFYAALLAVSAILACQQRNDTRPFVEPPPPGIVSTRIDYVDSDAFDRLFEIALTNQDPAILIQTTEQRPDWSGRLNAWIAAWNMGGRVERGAPAITARGQIPIPGVNLNSETIREFRLLVDDLMNRVETRAKERSAWWADEKVRTQRVALLRPYNLRFHMDDTGTIQLIFFNGRYANQYRDFVRGVGADAGEDWDRCIACSHADKSKASGSHTATFTGRKKP